MARIVIEIPEGANPEGLSVDSPDVKQLLQALRSKVLIDGKDISGNVFGFATYTDQHGMKRLLLELRDFEVFVGDGILESAEIV